MAVSEESRHRLYGRLEEVLGHDEATTFMAMVRPQGVAAIVAVLR